MERERFCNRMPLGLKIIRIFCVINTLVAIVGIWFLQFLTNNISWFPNALTFSNLTAWIISFVCWIMVFIAIHKKHTLTYALGLGALIMIALMPFRLLWSGQANFENVITMLYQQALTGVFLWYWLQIKEYSEGGALGAVSVRLTRADSIIKWFVVLWLIMYAAFVIIGAWNSLRSRALRRVNAAKYLQLLDGKSYKERLEYCSLSVPKNDKDICMITAFSKTKNKTNITIDDCDLLSEETYRFTCYSMGGYCDQIENETLANSCQEVSKIYQKDLQE